MTRHLAGCCGIVTPFTATCSGTRIAGMGIGEVVCSPSSPWQNPYAERLIGSIRRDGLDHVIVLGQRHLRRLLTMYVSYYHGARTHLALEKGAPTTESPAFLLTAR